MGGNGSFLRVQSSWSRDCSPEKGPSLPKKPGRAPEHTSPSCLQSKLVLPPPQCSAAPGLALRPSLRSPKPDPPRVSLAETCTPLPSPLPIPRHRSLSQELFFYARTYLLTCCLWDRHPTPTVQGLYQHLRNTNKEDAQVAPAFGACWFVTVHGP